MTTRKRLIGAVFFVGLLAWTIAGYSILSARQAATDHARTEAENLAAAFAVEDEHIIDGIARAMDVVATRMRAAPGSQDFYNFARDAQALQPQSLQVAIIGADGRLLASSLDPHAESLDLSDREHFRVHLDSQSKGIFISKPVTGKVSSQVTIQLTRRVEADDGTFLGVIVFALPPAAFAGLQKSVDIGRRGVIVLTRLDNIIISRFTQDHPDGVFAAGESVAGDKRPATFADAAYGSYVKKGAVDKVARILAYHRVGQYPVVVTVGLDLADALAPSRLYGFIILGFTGAATVLFAALGGHLIREIALRSKNEIALQEERTKLEAANTMLTADNMARVEAERLLRDAIEAMSEGFALYDADERLVLCNSKYRQLYAWEAELIVQGVRYETLVRYTAQRGSYADAIRDTEGWVAERLAELRNPSGPSHGHLSDGRWFRRANYRTASGGTICLRTDISAQMLTEHGLREAKDAAEAANIAKSQFLANMSHELRTPLNAIIGFSEALELEMAGPLQPKQAEYIADVHNSGRHLLNVINDILDLAKVDAGKFELHEEDGVDPHWVVASCINLVKPQAAAATVYLSTEIADRLPLLVADPTRLKQILLNLLSNAIKFSEQGGSVTVFVRCSRDGDVIFEVRDTGLGMTEDEIEIALQPFGQVEAAHARRYEGTGLGLPLARRLAELHGGSLHIASNKGHGTTVTVMLPVTRALARPPVESIAARAAE